MKDQIEIKLNAKLVIGFFLFVACLVLIDYAYATTPNPGHPWTDVGDGTFQITGPASLRTFTFPDADATVLTSNARVTVAQGGTGWAAIQSGTIPYGNGSSALSTTTAGTGGQVLALLNGVPTWASTTTLSTITGTLGLTGGGTNASLSAVNGGILYSGASALAISAAGSSGQILQSAGAAAPTWSTATYPATAGTAGKVLMSNGTNWVSTATTTPTVTVSVPPAFVATGAVTANTMASLTVFNLGLVNIPTQITVNQMTFRVSTVTTAGTMRLCVYNEAGTNLISVVSGTPATGANNVTVSPAVTLPPGNYYLGIGCATTCSNAISSWTTTSVPGITAATSPAGKKVVVGTGTMTSGTCNASLPTITLTINLTPIFRFDN